jgi:2-dehydropantoate 2-reductase
LIVGVGALGGVVGARLLASGCDVWLATRDEIAARTLRSKGLSVIGVGGDVEVNAPHVHPLGAYGTYGAFDLILLATKARDAIDAAPGLLKLLAPNGVLLPIQNGGVPAMLAEQHGSAHVLGGLSNLGATMLDIGQFDQRNAGYLLLGEVAGGSSARAKATGDWLARGVNVRVSENLRGSIWAKLLINCSVTTTGALAGCTMAEYILEPGGRELFEKAYDETLNVALASNNLPERLTVDPTPPARAPGGAYETWFQEVLTNYGAIKPSMLQDLEKKRVTEIDFINGYVAEVGKAVGVPVPVNAAMVEVIRNISKGTVSPSRQNLGSVLRSAKNA